MNKLLKKALAVFLCVWMLCLTGITVFAGSEEPIVIPTAVKLSQTSLSMTYGGTAQLTASVEPAAAEQYVTWSSSNTNLVTVDGNGNLTAAKDNADSPSGKQTVTITAASVKYPSVKATCTVTVDNDLTTKLGAFLKLITSVFTALFGAFSDPTKQFASVIIDLFKKLLEMVPKTTTALV